MMSLIGGKYLSVFLFLFPSLLQSHWATYTQTNLVSDLAGPSHKQRRKT